MKKIIALAVASAFVAPIALAEVTVYGSMRPNVEYTDVTAAGGSNLTKTQLIDNSSRLGFKGTDKLDSGLKLYWQVENRVRIGTAGGASTHTDGFTSRDSFVGIQGNFGSIQVGKISDFTDDFNGEYAPALASWNTASADVRDFILRDTARINNVAQYISPTFSGVRARLQYDFGNKSSTANIYGYEAELGYKSDLFRVAGIYKNNKDTTATGNGPAGTPTAGAEYKKYVLAANVTPMKGFDVSGEWTRQKTKANTATAEVTQDAYGFGALYAVGKHGVALQYAKLKNDSTANSTNGADVIAVQYKYSLSKQTILLATASRTKNEATGQAKVTGSVGTPAQGDKITTVSAGLRTDF